MLIKRIMITRAGQILESDTCLKSKETFSIQDKVCYYGQDVGSGYLIYPVSYICRQGLGVE
ncbi:hypothetical protein C7N83_08730 [Neisseria iguanae]|uniref:Uncharacterized protein n=1 Tax=Neisseria iguanae TaxID=90242 RepID=A0A2P7TZ76_9NEIS|nr:hypothetical protein C7N83_08730 [Neisseria iguanae]